VAAQGRIAGLERRSDVLLAEARARQRDAAEAAGEARRAGEAASAADAAAAASEAGRRALQAEADAARAELRAQAAAGARAARELDDARQELAATEADLDGLRMAMDSAQSRFIETLRQQREEANALLQKALTHASAADAARAGSPEHAALQSGLESLVADVKALLLSSSGGGQRTEGGGGSHGTSAAGAVATSSSSRGGSGGSLSLSRGGGGGSARAAGGGGSVSGGAAATGGAGAPIPESEWLGPVLQRLKGLVLEADRRAARAEADARISGQRAELVGQRVGLLESLLTRTTGAC